MPVTPYVVGQWVRGEKFYGRDALIHDILEGNRNCLWLLGTRRIGKTSTLKQLEHLTARNPELGYFSVFWDFQGAEEPEDLHEGFAESLLDAMDRLEELGIPLEKVESEDLFESISRLRRQLRSKDLTLLLLGDEVEELVEIKDKAPRFLRRLRRALQSTENIRTVLASKIKLWDLASEETSTSPFLHGFTPPLFVRGLEEKEARELIRQSKLPPESRPDLSEEVVERIREHCNHHPYLLQLLCERYLELGNLDRAIEAIATDQMVRHFFAVDFEMLTETERNIIRVIGQQSEATSESIQKSLDLDSSALGGDLSRLAHLGFVQRESSGGYALANFFFRRWFEELPSIHRAHEVEDGKREVLEPTIRMDNVGAMTGEPIGRIDDRYDLMVQLGRGATGAVYKAYDTFLESTIAIKILKEDYCADEEAMVRLRREVVLSRELSHANILKTYHLGSDNGQGYVTMSYVDGEDLARIIARDSPLELSRVVSISTKLASALAVAHGANVLHRDIKPSNILVDARGEPCIADFGLARLVSGPEVTSSGTFLGTPAYASPEQVQGENLDERSDLYALGVVLFEMATGRRPFEAKRSQEMLEMHVKTPAPSPRELRPEMSEDLCAVILRLLAKKPADRFHSASELEEALHQLEL